MADELTISKPTIGPRPVGDLNFDIGGKTYTYTPSTVRPQDMPYLLHLFIVLTLPTYATFDVKGYVEEHGLWHCFKERA